MKTTITGKGKEIVIDIQLTQFGNQIPYFSVTASVYPIGKPKTERNLISAGCCHEEIQTLTEKFNDVIALHLSDIDGKPMYPLENGFYHYAEGIKEDGNPEYFKNKDQEQAFKAKKSQCIYEEFLKRTKLKDTPFTLEAYNALSKRLVLDSDKELPENYYKTLIAEIEKEYRTPWPLIVERNNKHLSSHLRISLEEAEAIPAGLTKKQFYDRYVLPNIDRWKQEADAVIQKYNLTVERER